MFGAIMPVGGEYSVEIDGRRFGAEPDALGPIGGGAGYRALVEPTGAVIRTLDELLARLAAAQPGEVLWLDGAAEIDCTERVHIEQLVLEVPGGVMLASDRGRQGSAGALIRSDTFQTRPLFRVLGPGVRFSGLRLQGPNPKRCNEHHRRSFGTAPDWQGGRGHEYYYRFPVSDGIEAAHDGLTVDNCELGGWSHAAIWLRAGRGHHIHHNFIHHNQYNGLGYGIAHDRAFSLIERNLFDRNRHSIAGTGNPGSGYEARHNVELGESLSHCFDMHGGRDRKDGTDVAGSWLKVRHNTFGSPELALMVRGDPAEQVLVEHNWFYHATAAEAVRGENRVRLGENAGGYRPA